MKKVLALAILFCVNVFAETITVAMAANVGSVLDDLKASFAKIRPNDTLQVTLGASGKFAAQIENGAPFMVLVSADTAFPQKLKDSGYAVMEPKVYANGILAMLTTKNINISSGLNILTNSNIQKIAIANPKTAPYGTAAIEAMTNAGVYNSAVASKIVQGESIAQAYQFTITATDIGFVNLSSLKSGDGLKYKEGTNYIIVDEKLYKPIQQAVVLLKNGEKSDGAKAFVEFLTSKNAKDIFTKHGYK